MVVAGEVEDDAGGADDELDVGLPEQLDQRPDQALQVADVVGRVREVPEGPHAVQLGLVAWRAEVLGDGVDAARPDDGLLVVRAHGQHLEQPRGHEDEVLVVLRLHDLHQELRALALQEDLFGERTLHREDPEAVRDDGEQLVIRLEVLEDPDHVLHPALLADDFLAAFTQLLLALYHQEDVVDGGHGDEQDFRLGAGQEGRDAGHAA